MRSRVAFISITILVAGLLGIGVLAQHGARDRVITRDGHSVVGHLDSFDGRTVVISGQSIPRHQVEWIGLTAKIPAPLVKNAVTDEVHKRNGSVESGRLMGITLRKVVTDARSYDRQAIAWIHLVEAPPDSGAGGSGATRNDAGRRDSNNQNDDAKSLPPWFEVDHCQHKDRAEKCFWTGVAPHSCNITVCVCGYHIDTVFDEVCTDALWASVVPIKGLEVCCDKFKEGLRTHQPCDPTDDFDCDGVPNKKDLEPFGKHTSTADSADEKNFLAKGRREK